MDINRLLTGTPKVHGGHSTPPPVTPETPAAPAPTVDSVVSSGPSQGPSLPFPPTPPSVPATQVNLNGPESFPARIIIFRHGEKPDDGAPGVDPTGLTPQGEQRAEALATVLPQDYPHIDYLFAAANSANSQRPLETITPLADKLGLPVNTNFADKQYGALAQTLEHDPQYAGKTIAIAWHHGEIPALTQALGATPPETKWPGQTFDRMWEVDFSPGGQATVQNLPEKALPGDSTT